MTRRFDLTAAAVLVVLSSGAVSAQELPPVPDDIHEQLRDALPMEDDSGFDQAVAAPALGDDELEVTTYDALTGETTTGLLPPAVAEMLPDGEPTIVPTAIDADTGEAVVDEGAASDGAPDVAEASPWTVVADVQPSPYRQTVRIYRRFTPGGNLSFCSGVLFGPTYVVTSGTCVNNATLGRASEIYVHIGTNERHFPDSTLDLNYGVARGNQWTTPSAWSTSFNPDANIGWIRLDRPVGNITGSYLYTDAPASAGGTFDYRGHPNNISGPLQNNHRTYETDGTILSTLGTASLRYRLDGTYNGSADGAPAVERGGNNRTMKGVIAGFDGSVGNAVVKRISTGNKTNMDALVSNAPAPSMLADAQENTTSSNPKSLSTTTDVGPGDTFSYRMNVQNIGHTATDINARMYLSTGTVVDNSDYLVATRTFTNVGPGLTVYDNRTDTVPVGVPPGRYYVGWTMGTSTGENSFNAPNSAVIGPNRLNVVGPPVAPTLRAPDGGQSPVPIDTDFVWNQEDSAEWYLLWIENANGIIFRRWYPSSPTCGATLCTAQNPLNIGGVRDDDYVVTWWVAGWNQDYGIGPFSSAYQYKTDMGANPVPPTLLAPSGGGTGGGALKYEFETPAGTPPSYYRLYVQQGASVLVDQWYTAAAARCPSGGTCGIAPNINVTGLANWWVMSFANDGAAGFYGEWSAAKPFAP